MDVWRNVSSKPCQAWMGQKHGLGKSSFWDEEANDKCSITSLSHGSPWSTWVYFWITPEAGTLASPSGEKAQAASSPEHLPPITAASGTRWATARHCLNPTLSHRPLILTKPSDPAVYLRAWFGVSWAEIPHLSRLHTCTSIAGKRKQRSWMAIRLHRGECAINSQPFQ